MSRRMPISVPRIALVHTWLNTQDEGWYRVEFDRLGIPYTYISDQNRSARWRICVTKFDVIIFGPVRTSAQNIVRGNASFGDKEGPDPLEEIRRHAQFWQCRPIRPTTFAAGLGIEGVANIKDFVEAGGLFITVADNASLPIDFAVSRSGVIDAGCAKQLQARGSVLNTVFADRRSPIAYGYDEKLAVYFNQSPILNVGGGGGFGGGGFGGGGAMPERCERPSGPRHGMRRSGHCPRATGLPDPDQRRHDPAAATIQPPPETRPRIVLRFAPEKELLASGMLAGGAELAGSRPSSTCRSARATS